MIVKGLVVCLLTVLYGCSTTERTAKDNAKYIEMFDSFNVKVSDVSALDTKKKKVNPTNINVDYPGKYKISEIDKVLEKTYHKRYIYKEYQRGKHTYSLPTYDFLNLKRSGPNWSINIEEKINKEFTIKGRNSIGELINTTCKTLKECFSLI